MIIDVYSAFMASGVDLPFFIPVNDSFYDVVPMTEAEYLGF